MKGCALQPFLSHRPPDPTTTYASCLPKHVVIADRTSNDLILPQTSAALRQELAICVLLVLAHPESQVPFRPVSFVWSHGTAKSNKPLLIRTRKLFGFVGQWEVRGNNLGVSESKLCYIYIYIYIYIHVHVYIYTYIQIYIYTYIHTYSDVIVFESISVYVGEGEPWGSCCCIRAKELQCETFTTLL